MKTIFGLLFVFIFSLGSSCEPEFKYQNNSRIIIEGFLVNDDNSVLANQKISIFSSSLNNDLEIISSYSDPQGKIFITTPRGNNPMYIEFENKKIVSMDNYTDLVKNSIWIGFLSESYYNFGIIKLTNIN